MFLFAKSDTLPPGPPESFYLWAPEWLRAGGSWEGVLSSVALKTDALVREGPGLWEGGGKSRGCGESWGQQPAMLRKTWDS